MTFNRPRSRLLHIRLLLLYLTLLCLVDAVIPSPAPQPHPRAGARARNTSSIDTRPPSAEKHLFTAVKPDDKPHPGQCHPIRPCRDGVLLAVWTPVEVGIQTKVFRAGVYFVVMAYLFYGVSIVADR